mmetsp:Transcript_9353/g.20391  ORF Transcript_9353/g.20391 Transcript_9353/m.20391 type:complete len:369 (+) Transcript_9353:369-1475(+)
MPSKPNECLFPLSTPTPLSPANMAPAERASAPALTRATHRPEATRGTHCPQHSLTDAAASSLDWGSGHGPTHGTDARLAPSAAPGRAAERSSLPLSLVVVVVPSGGHTRPLSEPAGALDDMLHGALAGHPAGQGGEVLPGGRRRTRRLSDEARFVDAVVGHLGQRSGRDLARAGRVQVEAVFASDQDGHLSESEVAEEARRGWAVVRAAVCVDCDLDGGEVGEWRDHGGEVVEEPVAMHDGRLLEVVAVRSIDGSLRSLTVVVVPIECSVEPIEPVGCEEGILALLVGNVVDLLERIDRVLRVLATVGVLGVDDDVDGLQQVLEVLVVAADFWRVVDAAVLLNSRKAQRLPASLLERLHLVLRDVNVE